MTRFKQETGYSFKDYVTVPVRRTGCRYDFLPPLLYGWHKVYRNGRLTMFCLVPSMSMAIMCADDELKRDLFDVLHIKQTRAGISYVIVAHPYVQKTMCF